MSGFDGLPFSVQVQRLHDLAQAGLGQWDLPEGAIVRLINLSENATYEVAAPDGQKWALRVHRDGYHSKAAIASELAWLMDLRNTGVVVTPRPVPGRMARSFR